MGYVKTPEEVAAAKELFENLTYGLETVSVYFDTDAEFVADVLPPSFTPGATAKGLVRFGRSLFREGQIDLEYNYCACYVNARHEEFEGWYHLTMLLNEDMGTILGRELYGEAKKVGGVVL